MSDLCNTKAYLWQSARGHVSWHSVKGDPHVAGAWSERKKMFHGGSFLKLADDDVQIENPEAQKRQVSGF